MTEKELQKLCEGVVKALEAGPLDPKDIRTATGNLSRSLGDEGKKKGVTTTLPLALSRLQARGNIRRIPSDGRLDQQRYAYALWKPNPLDAFTVSPTDALRQLAEKFFQWTGPATAKEFQWFSGLGVKATAELLDSIAIEPYERGSDRLILSEDLAAFKQHRVPKKSQVALVSSLDAITALRRDVLTLVDEADLARVVAIDKKTSTLGALSDLPSHAIVDRGRLIGLWEYDPDAQKIVYGLFVPATKEFRTALEKTEAYIRDQLGDARSFSLDSPKSRQPRLEWLKTFK